MTGDVPRVLRPGAITEEMIEEVLGRADTDIATKKGLKEGEKPKTSRTPVFPAEWQNQFGLPVEEHRKQLQVNIFDGYTVFSVQDPAKEASAPGQ